MIVEKMVYGRVRLGMCGSVLDRKEAIQLAKDLLMACDVKIMVDIPFGIDYWIGVPGPKTTSEPKVGVDAGGNEAVTITADPPAHSGMSLDEIQEQADRMFAERSDNMYLPTTKKILELIANLAARVKEQKGLAEIQKVVDAANAMFEKCPNCGYEG